MKTVAIECPLQYCKVMIAMCSPQMCPYYGEIPPAFGSMGTTSITMEQYYHYGQGPEISCIPCCVTESNNSKMPSEYYYYY